MTTTNSSATITDLRFLVLIACIATLTACSVSEPGTVKPDKEATPSSDRPREIRLDGRNPCELMTTEQLDRIARTTSPRPGTSKTFKSPNCTFNATGARWRITPVTTEGIDAWTGGTRHGQAADIPPVAGFPAITVTLPGDTTNCDVAVDVAEGQYLYAAFEISKGFLDHFPKPCEGARQVAEAAMQNLTK